MLGGIRMSLNKKKEVIADDVEVYDLRTKTVSTAHPSPHHAINFQTFQFDKYLITAGGATSEDENGTKMFTDEMNIYDPDADKWYRYGSLNRPGELKGVQNGDTLFALNWSENEYATLEAFNLTRNVWESLGQIPMNLEDASMTYLDHNIYIFKEGVFFKFNTVSRQFKKYHINIYVSGAGLHASQGYLYLIGGCIRDEFSIIPSNNVYKIDVLSFLDTEEQALEAK